MDSLLSRNNRSNLIEVNAAFSIKNCIQEWCLKEIVNSIDLIISNKPILKAESLFNEIELIMLEELKELSINLYLPYLNLNTDKNTGIAYVDWPEESISEIVKNNYNNAIKAFIQELKDMADAFEEFKGVLDVKFNKFIIDNRNN